VTIIRKGEAAKKFDDVKVFYDYFSVEAEKQAKQAQLEEQGKNMKRNMVKLFKIK
jgi:peptidylprolyl isomerase